MQDGITIRPATEQRPWRLLYVFAGLFAMLYSLLALLFAARRGGKTGLPGDPILFAQRMAHLFSGQIPYLDFPFEHLPLSVLPMAAVYAVIPSDGILYVWVFAVLMFTLMFATGVTVERIAESLDLPNGGHRWLVLTAPLLPLVLFRVDPFSVFLASLALLAAVRGLESASVLSTIAAIAAKGWPVVLVPADWWRGRRLKAFLMTAVTLTMIAALLLAPGFRSGRSFVGVHQETLSGSILVVARLVRGVDPDLVTSAGAVYVQAGLWALLLNVAVGASLAIWALTVLRKRFTWRAGIALVSSLTLGLMFASPLLSAQFLLWPLAFVALIGRRQAVRALIGASIITILLLTSWAPSVLLFQVGWLVRNLVLLAAAVATVHDGLKTAGESP